MEGSRIQCCDQKIAFLLFLPFHYLLIPWLSMCLMLWQLMILSLINSLSLREQRQELSHKVGLDWHSLDSWSCPWRNGIMIMKGMPGHWRIGLLFLSFFLIRQWQRVRLTAGHSHESSVWTVGSSRTHDRLMPYWAMKRLDKDKKSSYVLSGRYLHHSRD